MHSTRFAAGQVRQSGICGEAAYGLHVCSAPRLAMHGACTHSVQQHPYTAPRRYRLALLAGPHATLCGSKMPTRLPTWSGSQLHCHRVPGIQRLLLGQGGCGSRQRLPCDGDVVAAWGAETGGPSKSSGSSGASEKSLCLRSRAIPASHALSQLSATYIILTPPGHLSAAAPGFRPRPALLPAPHAPTVDPSLPHPASASNSLPCW